MYKTLKKWDLSLAIMQDPKRLRDFHFILKLEPCHFNWKNS